MDVLELLMWQMKVMTILALLLQRCFWDKIIHYRSVLFTKDAVEITMPRLSQMILDTGCDQMHH